MRNLVVFLEEQSAKEMLRKLLPRILPGNIAVRYIVFEGKQDLEKQLIGKLRGWLIPETSFLVLRDQDVGDCLKTNYEFSRREPLRKLRWTERRVVGSSL